MSFDWYKRDSGAWLEIESQLTLEQAGALNMLADTVHNLNRPLVDDDKRVAGLLGCHVNKWRPIKRRLIDAGAIVIEGESLDIPCISRADSAATRPRLSEDSPDTEAGQLVPFLGKTKPSRSKSQRGEEKRIEEKRKRHSGKERHRHRGQPQPPGPFTTSRRARAY